MVLAVGQGELDQGYSGPVRVTVVRAVGQGGLGQGYSVGQGGLGQGYSGRGCRTG